jgi:light-regulated signal transduction histidine kinase (bacteriophytochrome)
MTPNGHTIPVAGVVAFVSLVVWGVRLEGLAQANDERSRDNVEQVQVAAKTSADIKERLIRVEEQAKALAKDADDIKEEQKEQSKKLDEILRKLSQE